MGRRSRYIAHRRGFIAGARRFYNTPGLGEPPNLPAEWESWRYFKLRYLWDKRGVILQTFKDSRRVKQTATAEPRPFALYNRAQWRRLRKQYAH